MVCSIMISSWKQAWRRRQRLGGRLLLAELREDGVRLSCWQAQGRLWQEERSLPFAAGENAYWEQAADILRELLLWRRLPEGTDSVLLLKSGQVYSESLTLPLLADGELRRAAFWEAEQAAPWGECCCGYRVLEREAGELQVRLWAVPSAWAEAAMALAAELRLSLQGLLAETGEEAAARSWYDGSGPGTDSMLPGRSWCSRLAQSRILRRTAAGCLLLALLLCCGARLGCWLAEQELQSAKAELEEYAPWQERHAACRELEREIEQLQRLEQSLDRPVTVLHLQRLGSLLTDGCWLLRVQKNERQWRIEGVAAGYEELQTLLQRLQASPLFEDVGISSSSGSAGVRFVLQLQEKRA